MKVLGIVTMLLLTSDLICGLWVRFHPQSDMNFHFWLGIAALVSALVTVFLYLCRG